MTIEKILTKWWNGEANGDDPMDIENVKFHITKSIPGPDRGSFPLFLGVLFFVVIAVYYVLGFLELLN